MTYLKCALAGGVAVLMLATVTVFVIGIYLWTPAEGSGAPQWDPISLTNRMTWVVLTGVFLVGFFWQFRRIRSR